MVKVTVKSTTTNAMKFLGETLKELADMEALVGIPQEESSRKGSGEINNAELLFIHTKGSPIHNIPPRPVIEPAIEAEDNKELIVSHLANSLKHRLDKETEKAVRSLALAGQAGMNAARGWFFDPRNGWKANSPATVRAKLEKLKGGRQQAALAAFDAGQSTYEYGGRTRNVDTPLIDTGQLRASITYVIRVEGETKVLPGQESKIDWGGKQAAKEGATNS